MNARHVRRTFPIGEIASARAAPARAAPARCAFAVAAAVALAGAPSGLGAQAAPGAGGSVEGVTRYVVAPTGNTARFLVREQLLGRDLPNDAVGETSRVQGAVVLDAGGRLVPGRSRIVVDLADLTSDSERRDRYIKGRTLDTERHPVAVLVPTRIAGLEGIPPVAGEASFRLIGDMTVSGLTREVTWEVTARREGDAVVGRAATRFPFATFGLEIPRVRSVLSVDDDIRLEYDFRFIPEG